MCCVLHQHLVHQQTTTVAASTTQWQRPNSPQNLGVLVSGPVRKPLPTPDFRTENHTKLRFPFKKHLPTHIISLPLHLALYTLASELSTL